MRYWLGENFGMASSDVTAMSALWGEQAPLACPWPAPFSSAPTAASLLSLAPGPLKAPNARGLHSSTFQLNLSTLYGMGVRVGVV